MVNSISYWNHFYDSCYEFQTHVDNIGIYGSCFEHKLFYYKYPSWGNNFKSALYHPRSYEYYYNTISLSQENKLLFSKLNDHIFEPSGKMC